MTVEHIRFAPAILRRLGEELIPAPEQGVLELVRNAYDADATRCVISLNATRKAGGSICVTDDGDGMDLISISQGWLVVGQSRKEQERRSRRRRRQVGEKGLGRLAALRLGHRATLASRPRAEPGIEYVVSLDWDAFDAADVIEDVAIEIARGSTTKRPGVEILIEDVRTALTERTVERLARAVVLLADPFGDPTGFRPQLDAPEFREAAKLIARPLRDVADLTLHAELDASGLASAIVRDWRKRPLFKATHEDLVKAARKLSRGEDEHSNSARFGAPAATFDLWMYLLKEGSFSVRRVPKRDLQQWMATVGGVHLYHRGLRAGPYGDPGHDWLDMNLARVRSPEDRPSTNNSVGRIVVADEADQLLQKTDRSGFVETEAYVELRRFARATLEWMATVRLRESIKRRDETRDRAPKAASTALAALEKAVGHASAPVRTEAQKAIRRLVKAQDRQRRALEIELELYRTLGTIGTTVGVFAHESARPVQMLDQSAGLVESAGRKALGAAYETTLAGPLSFVRKATDALRTFSALPLQLLKRNKRELGIVDVNQVIVDLIDIFQPHLASHKIAVDARPSPTPIAIYGTRAALEAIAANLVTNAIAALTDSRAKLGERVLRWSTELETDTMLLTVSDNGPGILDIDLEDIWLPGQTTRENGTGLGLTIARDATRDLQGRITAVAHGDLGGAEFTVLLPVWTGEEEASDAV
jgi:signal transduction histidine kinase